MSTPVYKEKIIELVTSTSERIVIQEGESFNITGQFKDLTGSAIIKVNLLSLVFTLYDEETEAILNSQNETNILSSVDTDGSMTHRVEEEDNIVVGTTVPTGRTEAHIARFKWTWNDGTQIRTGLAEYRFRVQKNATPA